jgi:hypothetical protein
LLKLKKNYKDIGFSEILEESQSIIKSKILSSDEISQNSPLSKSKKM